MTAFPLSTCKVYVIRKTGHMQLDIMINLQYKEKQLLDSNLLCRCNIEWYLTTYMCYIKYTFNMSAAAVWNINNYIRMIYMGAQTKLNIGSHWIKPGVHVCLKYTCNVCAQLKFFEVLLRFFDCLRRRQQQQQQLKWDYIIAFIPIRVLNNWLYIILSVAFKGFWLHTTTTTTTATT